MKRTTVLTALMLVPSFALAQGLTTTAETSADATVQTDTSGAGEVLAETKSDLKAGADAVAEGVEHAADATKDAMQEAVDGAAGIGAEVQSEIASDGSVMDGSVDGSLTADATVDADGETIGDLMLSQQISAEDLTGAEIYTMAEAEGGIAPAFDSGQSYTQIEDTWENIGSIEDVLFDENGEMTGVVAEVGGWLGIGDSLVVMTPDQVSLVEEENGDYAVVTAYSEAEVEALPKADTVMSNG